MHYTTAAIITLFVKVRLRKSPYSNKTIALRITANFYEDFSPSTAMYMRELSTNATMQHVQLLIAQLQQQANAANVQVNIPNALYKKLNVNKF